MRCSLQKVTYHVFLLSFAVSSTVISVNEGSIINECALPCENGGVCRQGAPVISEFNDLPFIGKYPSRNDMHCWCPRGYIGNLCEVQLEICSSSEEKCIDGSNCKFGLDADGKEFYYCGCSPAGADGPDSTAARMCQHADIEFCKIGVAHSFCANGGKCTMDSGEGEHTGCLCPENYAGRHCELKGLNPSSPSLAPSQLRVLYVVFFVFMISAFMFSFFTVTGKLSPMSWYSTVSSSTAHDVEMTPRPQMEVV